MGWGNAKTESTARLQPLLSRVLSLRLPLLAIVIFSIACSSSKSATPSTQTASTPPAASQNRTYTTSFSTAENPISESGNWLNGKVAGLDWANVATTPGFAFGTESGAGGYDDSTALLAGTWGSDQMAEATVHSVNQTNGSYEEVELRLRSSLSAHTATGYEINFRCLKTGDAYTQIVRWNGPLGSFTYVTAAGGAKFGVQDGDVVKATIVGSTITAYINGTQVAQGTDSTFTIGSPGMGFFFQGSVGNTRDYGFTSFTASDSPDAVNSAR